MINYDTIEIDYKSINIISIGNVVYFNSSVWKIYDIENNMLYLKSPLKENIGVPMDDVTPIILTPEIMHMCGFLLVSTEYSPQYYIGKDLIQTKTEYHLFNDKFDIDMKLNIVMDYKLKEDQYFIDSINEINENSTNLLFLHQIQNLFKKYYNFELIDIES
jgi:hypothetical protein